MLVVGKGYNINWEARGEKYYCYPVQEVELGGVELDEPIVPADVLDEPTDSIDVSQPTVPVDPVEVDLGAAPVPEARSSRCVIL